MLENSLHSWPNIYPVDNRSDTRSAPSQWEMQLQSNAVSHWLGTNLELVLDILCQPVLSKISAAVMLVDYCNSIVPGEIELQQLPPL